MNYRPLGQTGLSVSAVSIGTAALGADYGIVSRGKHWAPREEDAVELLGRAVEAGVNFFDTAPSYGCAEGILGRALRGREKCFVATKVKVAKDLLEQRLSVPRLREMLVRSVHQSLEALERPKLDVLQIHNATLESLLNAKLLDALEDVRFQGLVSFLGASVYTVEEASAVLDSGVFQVLQIPFSALDQRFAPICVRAVRSGVGVLGRSPLLKGVLTDRALYLPEKLAHLRDAAEEIMTTYTGSWGALPDFAIRFSLSAPGLASTLVGPASCEEVASVIAAVERGPLPEDIRQELQSFALDDPRLVDPSQWNSEEIR